MDRSSEIVSLLRAINDKMGEAPIVTVITLTQAQYDALVQSGEIDSTTLYIISDAV